MAHTLRRWFDVYQGEVRLFLLSALVLFFVRSSGVLFGNYAETAFLKRFGIEYLPILIVVNSLCTFVVMGFFGRMMARVPAGNLLRRTLIGCGVVVGTLRLAVPLGFDLLYPVLYVLRTQFDLLLTFLFWNLANERFSTRQSKRLFPLITAGGIVGGILGSFATPLVARMTSVDNFMWLYGILVLTGATFTRNLAQQEKPPSPQHAEPGEPSGRSSLFQEIRRATPVLRGSSLARSLVLMTLLPNIVIPLLNYQFSFAVDMNYGSEAAMLGFYSTFRGVQYILALVISLFAGRLYARFGIPTSLLFHPLNYLFVFAGFLFQFDIFTAVYAGISVGVLRMSVHNPARTALFGLFQERERVLLRVLLRSTVVRVGLLLGSLLVLVCQSGYFAWCRSALHPQNLSPFGMFFAGLWVWVTLRLRRKYPAILLRSIGHEPPAAVAAGALVSHGVRLPAEVLFRCRERVDRCYRSLFAARDLRRVSPPSPHRELLARHLEEAAKRDALEILSAAAQADSSGQLATVRRALDSGSSRRRSNALETLDHLLDRSLARPLLALLDDLAPGDRLAAGARYLQNRRPARSSAADLIGGFLRSPDWVTQLLALHLAQHGG
ncbi:MAG TPA: hypothetical protein VK997_13225, partial [Deferrisomatales bacterium]|nr:hypothetical protein [Deferrisomatales bacterium]